MRIGIIYCETLKSEIKILTSRTPQISHLREMPWTLHIDPDELLAEVRRQIEDLQEQVDVIVLGYGRCQSLDRLGKIFKVPVLLPEAEDCIGVLLGQKRYEKEIQQTPGTWFLSPGWTRMGIEFVFHELQLSRVGHKNIDPLKLARRMLDGFSRALFIEIPFCDEIEDLRPKAQKIADDLGLRLEATKGSCKILEKVIQQALDGANQPTSPSE
ncbi:MAG: DUF1638 domain-containing protein [Desulforhopalus sp.]